MVAYDNDAEYKFFFCKLLKVEAQNWLKIKKLLSNCSGPDCLYVEATKAEFYIIASKQLS